MHFNFCFLGADGPLQNMSDIFSDYSLSQPSYQFDFYFISAIVSQVDTGIYIQ